MPRVHAVQKSRHLKVSDIDSQRMVGSHPGRQGPQGPRCHAQPEAARGTCASTGAGCGASLTDWLVSRQPMAKHGELSVTTKFFGQPASALHNLRLGLKHKHIHPHTLRHCFATHSARSRRRPAHQSRCCSGRIGPRGDRRSIASLRRHLSATGSPLDALTIRWEKENRHKRMNRPPLRWPTSFRCAGQSFIEAQSQVDQRDQQKSVAWPSHAATTPALGGHRDSVPELRTYCISYNSCATGIAHGARATPACAGSGTERELLAHHYVHVVFTLPRELAAPRNCKQAN